MITYFRYKLPGKYAKKKINFFMVNVYLSIIFIL